MEKGGFRQIPAMKKKMLHSLGIKLLALFVACSGSQFMMGPAAHALDELDQVNDIMADTYQFRVDDFGQTFTAGRDGFLYDLALNLTHLQGQVGGVMTVDIIEGKSMTGPVLGTSSIPNKDLPIGQNFWHTFHFYGGVPMQSGKVYTIRLHSTENYPNWLTHTVDHYPRGGMYRAGNWLPQDGLFRTYVSAAQHEEATMIDFSLSQLSVLYGDTVVLSAKLLGRGQPLADQKITFTIDQTEIGSAVTDGSGVATLNYPVNKDPGMHQLKAAFAGDNIEFAGSSALHSLEVDRGYLTIKADDVSREYGMSNLFHATYTGLAPWDSPASLGEISYSTTATPSSPVGIYQIYVSDFKSNKYHVTYMPGLLNVTKAPLTVTASDATRRYGEANPVFQGTLTGLRNGDAIQATYDTSASPTSAVGNYLITAGLDDPDLKLRNYNVTRQPGMLKITPAPLSVTTQDVSRWVGYPNPAFTGTLNGVTDFDDVTATYHTDADENSPAGDYPITAEMNDPQHRLGNYDVTHNYGMLKVYDPPAIGFSGNDQADRVTGNVTLPGQDASGSEITWTSTDTQVIDPQTGHILRPSREAGDAQVTLTAAVHKNGTEYAKQYPLTVKALEDLTDSEAASRDEAALEIGFAPGDGADHVTQPVVLPATGQWGSGISWSSSEPDVIDPQTGQVHRPQDEDAGVTLTATIARGNDVRTKPFELKVLKEGVPAPSPTGLAFSQEAYSLAAGQSLPTVVNSTYSDGASYVLSDGVVFASAKPEIAGIDERGVIRGLSQGQTVISATYGGMTAQATVTVTKPAPPGNGDSGSVSPVVPDLPAPPKNDPVPEFTLQIVTSEGKTEKIGLTKAQLQEKQIRIETKHSGGTFLLSQELLENMKSANPDAALVFQNGMMSFKLPLSELDAEKAAAAAGLSGSDLRFQIVMEPKASAAKLPNANGAVLSEPSRFDLLISNGKDTPVPVSAFGQYVESTLSLGEKNIPATAFVVWLDESSGEYRFVPARFETKNGETFAVIQRRGTGVYTVLDQPAAFKDLERHWGEKEILLLASKRIVQGRTDEDFVPEGAITRGEAAALLVRALGLKDEKTAASFSDVSEGWYEAYIGTASQADLIQGYADGTFRPSDNISREQLASMLIRAIRYTGKTPTPSMQSVHAADREQISGWAREAVDEAAGLGILQGNEKGALNPGANVTRAEAAIMLYRTLKQLDFI